MYTKTDIQQAAHRIQKGQGIIRSIMEAKKEAVRVLNGEGASKGRKVFLFNAASL